MWYIYLLYNTKIKRTYIGATKNVAKRLRQHRGEIVGGAKATSKERASWMLIGYVSGFEDKKAAYRWEKIIKSRCRGLDERIEGFINLTKGECPKFKNRPNYEVPKGLRYETGR